MIPLLHQYLLSTILTCPIKMAYTLVAKTDTLNRKVEYNVIDVIMGSIGSFGGHLLPNLNKECNDGSSGAYPKERNF